MTTHELKIEPRWYQRVIDKTKTAELRLNDRDFQAGDWLVLREYARLPFGPSEYTRRSVRTQITHVLTEAPGLKRGYVVLSFTVGGAS